MSFTRRRALVALLVVGLASAAAGAGTMALFSDTEQSTDNTVSAGTLNLAVDSGETPTTTFNVNDAKPTDSGTNVTNLTNNGSLDGSLDVLISNTTNHEGSTTEAEVNDSGDGELGGELEATVYLSSDQTVGGSDTELANGTLNAIANQEFNVNETLESGQTKYLVVDWNIPESVGNEIQGDTVSVDFTVELNQEDSQ